MTKKLFRRLFAALLALALAAPQGLVFASPALGEDLAETEETLHENTVLRRAVFYDEARDDLRQENYVVYTPNARVTPIVTDGEATSQLSAVPEAAALLEASGKRVVAGINGDYYGVQHGVPLGSVMTAGELQNATSDNYAIGFRADGTAILGRPELHLQAMVNGGSGFPIFAFNHVRQSAYGIFLYNDRFNTRHNTYTNEPGVDVVCRPVEGRLSIGEALTLRVEEVLDEAQGSIVPEGCYILTANSKAYDYYTDALRALSPGDEVTILVSAADIEWNDVEYLIGALYPLIEDGQPSPDLPDGAAPRTAVGQRADGTLLFYTVDGRQAGYSVGATLMQVAQRLIELGCVSALSLDGGGSTTLVAAMPDATAATVQNRPSEGTARAVTNHLFLVASDVPSGVPDHVYLSLSAQLALPNAVIDTSAALIDTNYIPMSGAPLTLTASGGSLEDGALTLPDGAERVTVEARWGGLSTARSVRVVPSPDAITLSRDGMPVEALVLSRGERVELSAQAYLGHLAVAGDNGCFLWTLEGDAGSVDGQGVLTAGEQLGGGTLTVSAGETSVSIPVTVSAAPLRALEDFETAFAPVETILLPAADDGENDESAADDAPQPDDEHPGVTLLSHNTAETFVRLGRTSARLEYTLGAEDAARAGCAYTIARGYDRLNLWLYGDGSGLAIVPETDAGDGEAAVVDFTGWRQLSLALPAHASRIAGFALRGTAGASGTLYLDGLVLSYGGIVDQDAPELSFLPGAQTPDEPDGAPALAGRAYDAVDAGSLALLQVTLDGTALESSSYRYDARTGALSVPLPEPDGFAHRLSVTAKDQSGNLARVSCDIQADPAADPVFSDTAEHWARSEIDWLGRMGLSNGDGTGRYNPDTKLSRQEFAVLLFRFLAPAEDFSAVTLPFADADSIAPWALSAARATCALGIIKGTAGSDGQLRFEPTAEISRQEAVTMLGRLLEKGYAVPELPYDDAAEIAPWAAERVSVLAGLGALRGLAADRFLPTQSITRAEVATVFYRMT